MNEPGLLVLGLVRTHALLRVCCPHARGDAPFLLSPEQVHPYGVLDEFYHHWVGAVLTIACQSPSERLIYEEAVRVTACSQANTPREANLPT